jgi:hypothetical protein
MVNLVSGGSRRALDRVLDHQGAHHARRATARAGGCMGDHWHLSADRTTGIYFVGYWLLAPHWYTAHQQIGDIRMSLLWLILAIFLIFAIIGAPGVGPWNHGFGWYPSGGFGLIVIILLVLLLVGRL